MEPQVGRCVRDCFALRQDHLMVELIAAWEPQDDEQRYIQWAQNLSQALAPYAFKGGYINLLDEQERVRLAFVEL